MKASFYTDISLDEEKNSHVRKLEDYLEKNAKECSGLGGFCWAYKLSNAEVKIDYYCSPCPSLVITGVKVTVECRGRKRLESIAASLGLGSGYTSMVTI